MKPLIEIPILLLILVMQGELTVTLREGRDLPVWGLPWQSNPWCRLVLGEQAVQSRRDNDTSQPSQHGSPVWNQEVQFLVEDPDKQVGAGPGGGGVGGWGEGQAGREWDKGT